MAVELDSMWIIARLDKLVRYFNGSAQALMASPLAPAWHDGRLACYAFNNNFNAVMIENGLKEIGLRPGRDFDGRSNGWLEIGSDLWSQPSAVFRGEENGLLIGPSNFDDFLGGHIKPLRMRATVLLRDEGGRILLVRDKGVELFSLPGGVLKKNEPVLAAAAREIYEELGCSLHSIRRDRDLDYSAKNNRHLVVSANFQEAQDIVCNPIEVVEFCWWDGCEDLRRFEHVNVIVEAMNRVYGFVKKH